MTWRIESAQFSRIWFSDQISFYKDVSDLQRVDLTEVEKTKLIPGGKLVMTRRSSPGFTSSLTRKVLFREKKTRQRFFCEFNLRLVSRLTFEKKEEKIDVRDHKG